MSITGMTFNEFCKSVAEQEREDRAARRRLLRQRRQEQETHADERDGCEAQRSEHK